MCSKNFVMQYWHSTKRYAQNLRMCDIGTCVEILIQLSLNNPGFIGFKQLCPFVSQKSVRDVKYLGYYNVIKRDTSYNSYEHFDFLTVGENNYSNRTAVNRLTGRNRKETGFCVDW